MNSDGFGFLALLNCAWDLGQAVHAPVVVGLPLYHSDGIWRRGPNFLPFQMDADTRLQLKTNAHERQISHVPQVSALVDSAFDTIDVIFPDITFSVVDNWVKDPNNIANWGWSNNLPRLSNFVENNSLASITFWHEQIQGFRLVLGISEGRLWVDLTAPQENEILGDSVIWSQLGSPGRDRVSERLLEGSISAKICGSTSSERIVEISYDPEGKLRWPRYNAIYSDQLRNPYGALSPPRVPGKIDSWPKRPSALDFHSNLPPPKKIFHRPKREGFPTVLVHPTPTTLGWRTETEHLGLYIFKVQKGKEPYFELKDHWTPTNQTPSKVYLDGHEDDKLKTHGVFPCRYPGDCLRSAFKRPADLERHYQNVHTYESGVRYQCDHARCSRYSDSFTRKDHLRDHLRDYHKEDIGQALGAKIKSSGNNEINLDMRQIKEKWLAERKIETQWWRCGKCLIRCNVTMNGWVCPSCKTRCEESRILARGISPNFEVLPDETLNFGTTYHFCSTCVGNALVEDRNGAWVLCSHCHGDVYLTKPGRFSALN